MENPQYVSFAEGARRLSVDPKTLTKLVEQGEVRCIRISAKRRKLDLQHLLSWIQASGVPKQPEGGAAAGTSANRENA